MLFTEQELGYIDPFDILNESMYLTEDESIINPTTVPVKEVSRLGYGVVRFDDVDKLAESYGIDYIDAMYAIAESSDMDPEYLAVSVPEYEVIAYPEIVNELANIVIEPISEYDIEYQYVNECINDWIDHGDDYVLLENMMILNEISDEYILRKALNYYRSMPENKNLSDDELIIRYGINSENNLHGDRFKRNGGVLHVTPNNKMSNLFKLNDFLKNKRKKI